MATCPLVLSGTHWYTKDNFTKKENFLNFFFPKNYDEGDICTPMLENLIIAGHTLNHLAKCWLLREQLARRALLNSSFVCLMAPFCLGPECCNATEYNWWPHLVVFIIIIKGPWEPAHSCNGQFSLCLLLLLIWTKGKRKERFW